MSRPDPPPPLEIAAPSDVRDGECVVYATAHAAPTPHVYLEVSGFGSRRAETLTLDVAQVRAMRDWLSLALEALDP